MNKLINRIIKTELEKTKPNNWVLSPIGLEMIFIILIDSSKKEVQEELLEILEIRKTDLNDYKNVLSKVLKKTIENENFYLSSRNQINYTNHYNLNNSLLKKISEYFDLEGNILSDEAPFLEIVNTFKFGDKWKTGILRIVRLIYLKVFEVKH